MYAFTYLLGLIKWSGDCLTALLIRYSHRTAISWFNIRISIQDSPPQLNSVARSNLEYIHPYILHHLYSYLQSNLLLDRCFLRRDMYMCMFWNPRHKVVFNLLYLLTLQIIQIKQINEETCSIRQQTYDTFFSLFLNYQESFLPFLHYIV